MSRLAYVIFNKDSGEILSISNEASEENSYIQVPLADVMTLINAEEPTTNYHVQYNPKIKQLEFQSKHEHILDSLTVKDFIYELPQDNAKDADVQVIQDIPNTVNKMQQQFPDVKIETAPHIGASELMMNLLIEAAGSVNK